MNIGRGAAHFNQGGLGTGFNYASSIAMRAGKNATVAFDRSAERLATGQRINRGADDPSGLVAVERFRHDIAGINAALQNTLVARNTLDVAQGAMSDILNNLNALKQAALRSLGSDFATSDRSLFQDEADELINGIDRIVQNTQLAGNKILDGSGDFYTEATEAAFDELRVKRMTFDATGSRTIDMDVTRLAERASYVTNIDMAGGTGLVQQGGPAILSISGSLGASQVRINEDTTSQDLVAMINGATAGTGVFASSTVVNGAEAVVNFPDLLTDLELAAADSLTFDVTVNGRTNQVTLQGSADRDGDGIVEVTAGDLERALNSADLGVFNVIDAVNDAALPVQQNFVIRHAGASDFSLGNFANPGATMNGASTLLGGGFTISGTEPASARMYTTGAVDNSPRTFKAKVISGGIASEITVNTASASVADMQAALDNIATVTSLGTGPNGREILQIVANAGVDAIQFEEATHDSTDAADLGLLGHTGGGQGLVSKGMAVVALYSEGFGSDQLVGVRNAGPAEFAFTRLDEANPDQAGLSIGGGTVKSYGVDVQVEIMGKPYTGRGFHLNVSDSWGNFEVEFAPRLGLGSNTNQLNRALNLNYADATQQNAFGYQPVTMLHGTGSHAVTDLSTPFAQDLIAAGIVDQVSFTVFDQVPNSTRRSGLGVQLNGQIQGREYLGVRNMSSEYLGGLPSTETYPANANSRSVKGAGTLSQISRGGAFAIDGDTHQIQQAIKIIDRAIEQVISEKAHVGLYQTQTLDRNESHLSGLRDSISQTLQDYNGVDAAAEITNLSMTQIRFDAATSVLAQSNSRPQTLLQLLR